MAESGVGSTDSSPDIFVSFFLCNAKASKYQQEIATAKNSDPHTIPDCEPIIRSIATYMSNASATESGSKAQPANKVASCKTRGLLWPRYTI